MENYYKLFEIPNDADISILRSAFRKKAKSCHPDLFHHVSPEERKKLQKKFVHLTQAYETLADKRKRKIFDTKLRKWDMSHQKKDNQHVISFSQNLSRMENLDLVVIATSSNVRKKVFLDLIVKKMRI